ncbi:hypothetical protein [Croceicoccus hydrothermalis]|uniref:hypothetical protein n=1 Tax=Croceicoccus hydrothermalis TaxID=2867964 RepID=UPI001EFB7D22|nr:hypothetical protein [Croceicoccus hydrothermalis]
MPVSNVDQADGQMHASMRHAARGSEHADAQARQNAAGSQSGHADGSHAEQQKCLFTALTMASLAGADVDLLMAAIAFVMLLWLRPLPPMAIRRALRWQPPSRAPPLPA